MKKFVKLCLVMLILCLVPTLFLSNIKVKSFAFNLSNTKETNKTEPFTGMADVNAFMVGYKRWAANYKSQGGDKYLKIPVASVRGLSTENKGFGWVTIDLSNGSISAEIGNLDETRSWDIWLVNNASKKKSVKPEIGDQLFNVGTLNNKEVFEDTPEGKNRYIVSELNTEVSPLMVNHIDIDLVVVTETGKTPISEFALWGMPTLYQRLYLSGLKGHFGLIKNSDQINPSNWSQLDEQLALEEMIAKGRDLFVKETFSGNGRTCATCHREEENFTISPESIAKLPISDPIFVAETNSALSKFFENPQMLRTNALFIENVDGLDDLENKFTLRSSNHTLALSTSLTPFDRTGAIDFTVVPPVQRTGWGGDGAPGTGTLREFAIGAVTQHFPKTLGRKEGVDFRLPTEEELDALEAFQLSLGRQEDFDLMKLKVKGKLTDMGLKLYTDETNAGAKCNICHFNGGANAGFGRIVNLPNGVFNGSFQTDVDLLSTAPKVPLDGGFGTIRRPDGSFGDLRQRQFNTPPIVEAADTLPLFHDNGILTLEDSVEFYGTKTFNNSPVGKNFPVEPFKGGIKLNKKKVRAVAAFMRVLNILENIRSSIAIQQRAKNSTTEDNIRQLLLFSMNEDSDAIRVITEGTGPKITDADKALQMLQMARTTAQNALNTMDKATRDQLIDQAISQKKAARDLLVDPTTLPPSYQQ